MNAAFRLFRDILPFRQQMAEKESSDARELLDTAVGLSASEVAVQLTSHVIPIVVEQRNLTMRFKLLEDTRQEAETALPVLERHIDSSILPLPRIVRSSALAADNLLKALAAAYFDIAKTIAKSGHQRGYIHLLQRTVNRAMLLIARRQSLAYSSYTSPSSTSWLMLHELYQIVRDLRAIYPETNITPLEQQYLSALLFAYIDPSKLQRDELTVAIFCTQQLAVHATIVEVTPDIPTCKAAAPYFLVRPEEGNPGTPLLRLPKGLRNSGRLHRRLYRCARSARQVRRAADLTPMNRDSIFRRRFFRLCNRRSVASRCAASAACILVRAPTSWAASRRSFLSSRAMRFHGGRRIAGATDTVTFRPANGR